VSEATSYDELHLEDVGLLPSKLDMVLIYWKNRVKLVLSLLAIMEKCHSQNILHNDMSPLNIRLHFPPEHPKKVYSGVYNWDLANRVVENTPSLYGYAAKVEMEANIAESKHVVPKLFYVFGPQDLQNLLESMKKKHLYPKVADAYSISVLARQIWKEIWNREVFPNTMRFIAFDLKLNSLTD
jgi:hypothetical protein